MGGGGGGGGLTGHYGTVRACPEARDTDAIVKEVQMWPESQQMNWSEIARRHNVPGRNGGQIVNTIVQENGVEVSRFSANPLQKRARSSKRKFLGQEVFIPANPTPAAIQEDAKAMITSGKLITTSSIVYGRKFPFAEILKKLLDKHEQYMNLLPDSSIDSMPEPDLKYF